MYKDIFIKTQSGGANDDCLFTLATSSETTLQTSRSVDQSLEIMCFICEPHVSNDRRFVLHPFMMVEGGEEEEEEEQQQQQQKRQKLGYR